MFRAMCSFGKVVRSGAPLTAQLRPCSQSQGGYGEKIVWVTLPVRLHNLRGILAVFLILGLNQVMLLGRAGGAPQKRGTEENPVVVFSLATNTYHKHEQGDVTQHVQWHRISVFRPLLRDSVYANLSKGQRVLVRGSISYFSVQDNFSNKSSVTTIVAGDVIFLSPFSGSTDAQEADE